MSKRWGWIAGACLVAGPALASEGGAAPSMTHRMMLLVIQLGIILFAAKIGGMVFERMKLPGVLGELMAGVLIGPHLLGGISLPGFVYGLFGTAGPDVVSPELYGFCTVASIVLLFLVGLETDIKLLARYSITGSLVGIGGVVAAFVMGDLAAVLFSGSILGEPRGFMDPSCLFMGIIATATSVGISARILSEKRKLDSPEGVVILAAAVIDDVLGIILLAIGLGVYSARGEGGELDWGRIALIGGKAIGVWLGATTVGLIASRRISGLLKLFGDRSTVAVMALGLALILAGLFEEAGLAMIIGAYIMGLSLSRTDIRNVVIEKLHPIQIMFVPVFFTVMGMLTDVRQLASWPVIGFGLVYTCFASVGKIVGCGLPALGRNFNTRGALRIGAGMLPRGEVTLIMAGTGLAAGLLTAESFGAIVFMVFLASLTAPPILVGLFGSEASGLRTPGAPDKSSDQRFSFPSVEASELVMIKLLSAFEAEGVFVSAIDRRGQIYQLRKDRMVIGLQRAGTDVVFDSARDWLPIIRTAMLEVVADLELMARELRRPLDEKTLADLHADEGTVPVDSAFLAQYIMPRHMHPRLTASTKEEVIDELLALLRAAGTIQDVAAAREAVWERERSLSTGMQHGLAIPHGRTDIVKGLICAVGISSKGIDFGALDGQLSHIFVLVLSPKSAAAPHMQFMSMISHRLARRGRAALLACDTPDDMATVLKGNPPGSVTRPGLKEFVRWKRPAARPADYLNPSLVVMDLKADTKVGAIDELVAALAAHESVDDPDAIRAAIMAREEGMSTGMEHGIAVPHARLDSVDDLVCAIGLHHAGVDFGSIDGTPTHIIVLTVSPRDQPAPHLQMMAMVSRALDEEGRRLVLAAETPAAVCAVLARAGS